MNNIYWGFVKHGRIVGMLLFLSILCQQEIFAFPNMDENRRKKYDFNQGWLLNVGDTPHFETVSFDDGNWKSVTLPHAFNEDDAFRVPIDKHSTAIICYRKHFKLPPSAKNKKVFLEFEGIRQAGEFYLNGKFIGIHENGIMAFGLDITDYLNSGNKENVLAIRIDNSWDYKEIATGTRFQWNDKNFNANYGGIPKNVYLHSMGKVYQTLPLFSHLKTTGTYVYAKDINVSKHSAIVVAESEVYNETDKTCRVQLETVIETPDGNLVKKMTSSVQLIEAGEKIVLSTGDTVDHLHFWSWGYGYLYNVYTTLLVDGKPQDVVNTRTGFRKTRFADGMVSLNDRVIQMKGYAQRSSNEWPAIGLSVPAWLSDYSNGLMVEGNANLVRWMHITPWKQDVESCDRVGLIQAMPAGDSEKDATGRQWEQRKEVMRDAIIYNRNNPSILFYESGNKGVSEEHIAEMIAIRDQYDPYGGRAIGSREMLDSKLSEYGGEMLYINKSAGKPVWATEYSRDEGLRKYWDEHTPPFHKDGEGPLHKGQDAGVYNRNQDSHAIENVIRWFDYYRERPGTGKRVSSGGTNIVFSDSNTHFRGKENYRRSGEVDAMRLAKDAFYTHQVMWNGWVDVENFQTHIIGHWNYAPETVKDVSVVSSGESVELFLNGRSLGKGECSCRFLFTFKDVSWEKGVLLAVSYDSEGKEVSRDERKTAGEPFAIRMTERHAPDGFLANGADLALVEFEVVDKEGNRCPASNHLVHFELSGQGEWRGGIAQGTDNYILSRQLPVECGVNRTLIRSTTKAGKIYLKAVADGLQSANISWQTLPVQMKNGLSEYISAEHQPLRLSRGETPTTPSYCVSRVPVEIISARAGSNEEATLNSYDDNEESEWGSTGRSDEAWIQYELERDAIVSEVVLKFAGWRNRSYSIDIFIDNERVYEGMTPKSLGYVTLPLRPVAKGRFLRIQLAGKNTERDDFNSIVEVTGKKELEMKKTSKESLRIVEIEIYE